MSKASVLKHNKELIQNVMKENKISKKLSTAEKNKLILNAVHTDSIEENKKIENNTTFDKITSRSFKCIDCGREVVLNGDIATDTSIIKCSKCLSK